MEAQDHAKPAQNEAIGISADAAAILLKGNLRNLAKKVQEGKTLSASERNLLESALSGQNPTAQTFAKNQVELAEILGVDRKTIQRYKKIDGNPGARPDGRYDVSAWRRFVHERMGTLEGDDENLDAPKLKARQILLQNQKIESSSLFSAKNSSAPPMSKPVAPALP